MTYLQ
jgi:hypothetical protein